jgi:hypothetical protein
MMKHIRRQKRIGCALYGISTVSVPFTAGPDTATVATTLIARQVRQRPVPQEGNEFFAYVQEVWPSVLRNYKVGLQPMELSEWIMRFPPGRRAQIRRDVAKFDAGLCRKQDFLRKCFLKREMAAKGGLNGWSEATREKSRVADALTQYVYTHRPRPDDLPKGVAWQTNEWMYNGSNWVTIAAWQSLREVVSEPDTAWYAGRCITGWESYVVSSVTGPYFVKWSKELARVYNQHSHAFYASGKTATQIGEFVVNCERDGFSCYMDGDAEKFDSCFGDLSFDVIHYLYRRIGGDCPRFWKCVRKMRKHTNASFSINNTSAAKWTQGKGASRGSGDNDTTFGNSLFALFMHIYACARYMQEESGEWTLPTPDEVFANFRIAWLGDDVLIASKVPVDAAKFSRHYSEIGYKYDMVSRDSACSVSFLGGIFMPVIKNDMPSWCLMPDMRRWLPKIGWTTNVQEQPLKWCRSVALGWRHLARAHPIMRPICDAYLRCSRNHSAKPFSFDQHKRQFASVGYIKQHPDALEALRAAYGITASQVDQITALCNGIEMLPALLLSTALDPLL